MSEDVLFPQFSHFCFQYKTRYIITPLKSGLVIIDQHRAHVHILYHRYIGNIQCRRSVSRQLLFPEMLELTATEASMLASLNDEIRFLGFDLAHLGGNSYAIHATPTEITGGNPAEQIKNIINATMESGLSEKEKQTEKIALSLAKATAIHSGKTLSPEEMETIVASLFALETNGITPDGLPILTVITDEELKSRM
jgi:DNA mismatch repair protein MutL